MEVIKENYQWDLGIVKINWCFLPYCRKIRDKKHGLANFVLFFYKLCPFGKKNVVIIIFLLNSWIMQFEIGYKKEAIELSIVWSLFWNHICDFRIDSLQLWKVLVYLWQSLWAGICGAYLKNLNFEFDEFNQLQAFADALLVIPKILAQNSGYDPQETIVKLQVWNSVYFFFFFEC